MNSLVSTQDLDGQAIEWLLQSSQAFLDPARAPALRGNVAHLFFEPSTRTQVSFQIAAQRLGLKTLHFDVQASSVQKGESLQDTLHTLEALGVDLAVIRHPSNWRQQLDSWPENMGLINAGSGIFEHPTQALLDAFTIRQYFASFHGLVVTIVGDIQHSRVARSNLELLTSLGAQVQFAGPATFQPTDLQHVAWVDFDSALSKTDVLIMLRVQHERHAQPHWPADYHRRYGLTRSRLAKLRQEALILHPGPANRGVEVSDAAFQDARFKIWEQVTNGVAMRMAVLDWCLQGGRHEQLVSA